MNQLLRDPLNYKAKTLEEAINKHEELLRLSTGPKDWAFNIIESSKHLLPQYQDGFIKYLANPGGVDYTNHEVIECNAVPRSEMPNYPEFKVVKQQGNTTYIECDSLPLCENSGPNSDDEKLE